MESQTSTAEEGGNTHTRETGTQGQIYTLDTNAQALLSILISPATKGRATVYARDSSPLLHVDTLDAFSARFPANQFIPSPLLRKHIKNTFL